MSHHYTARSPPQKNQATGLAAEVLISDVGDLKGLKTPMQQKKLSLMLESGQQQYRLQNIAYYPANTQRHADGEPPITSPHL